MEMAVHSNLPDGPAKLDRALRLRGQRDISVHMISVPTPVLLRADQPISPNRTNYFPTPQLMLASAVQNRFERDDIPWNVHFSDFKSIPDMNAWDADLRPYEDFIYGGRKVTKCYVGDGLERLSQELADADIVCITANFTLEARPVVEAIAALRRMKKEKLILLGGRDAMARPDYFLRMGADLVAYGDADLALPELLARIYHGEELSGLVQAGRLLPALGRIVLDELPLMRFGLLRHPLTRYCESGGGQFLPSILEKGGVAYFETSRGCFRECNFCTERLTKRSEMSVGRFREEVDWYRDNGVNTIMLSDDNLLQRLNHAERGERELIEMFEFLHERQMVWEFPVGIEIGRLMRKNSQEFHERLFDLMFWNNDNPDDFTGVFRSLVPFENVLRAHDSELRLRKMRSISENFRILSRVIASGIPQINLAVMIGFPHDTEASLADTRRNLEEISRLRREIAAASPRRIKTHINFSLFTATPYPGTPYFTEALREGRMEYDIEEHPELWNLYTSVVRGDTFSAAETTQNRLDLLEMTRSHHVSGKVKLHLSDEALPRSHRMPSAVTEVA